MAWRALSRAIEGFDSARIVSAILGAGAVEAGVAAGAVSGAEVCVNADDNGIAVSSAVSKNGYLRREFIGDPVESVMWRSRKRITEALISYNRQGRVGMKFKGMRGKCPPSRLFAEQIRRCPYSLRRRDTEEQVREMSALQEKVRERGCRNEMCGKWI